MRPIIVVLCCLLSSMVYGGDTVTVRTPPRNGSFLIQVTPHGDGKIDVKVVESTERFELLTQSAPVVTLDTGLISPEAADVGRDRVLILTATWCAPCQELKSRLYDAFAQMAKISKPRLWKLGDSENNDFQIVDIDEHPEIVDFVAAELGVDASTLQLPMVLKVEDGKIVRQLEPKYFANLDQWTLGWTYTGIDLRPGEPLIVDPEAAPTPMATVRYMLSALAPQPNEKFVDFGCGYDARFCIEAVRTYGCKAVGVEIDPVRAGYARQAVYNAGLSDRIEIVEGDALEVDVDADVGVAYLYPEVLDALQEKLQKLNRFATYQHRVGSLPMTDYGNSVYVWRKPAPVTQSATVWGTTPGTTWYTVPGTYYYATPQTQATQQTPQTYVQPTQTYQSRGVEYNGRVYYGRVCNNPNCRMCNSIQWGLQNQR